MKTFKKNNEKAHIYMSQVFFEKDNIIYKQAPNTFFFEKCIEKNWKEITPILKNQFEIKLELWKNFQRENNKINPPFSKHRTPVYCGNGYTSFPGKGIKFTGDFLDSEL